MLFWRAPRQTEIVQRTKAPVVPSAPIEAPSAAIRNPGFARAITKPSHHVMALRSCLSSTWAVAIRPSPYVVTCGLSVATRPAAVAAVSAPAKYQLVQFPSSRRGRYFRELRSSTIGGRTEMATLVKDRSRSDELAGTERGDGAPVGLGTLSCRIDPEAEQMAIESALQAGSRLLVTNVVHLENYPSTVMLLGPAAATLPHEEDLEAVRA